MCMCMDDLMGHSLLQARDRLQLFRDTRPAQASRKGGASREDIVDKLAEDLLVKVRARLGMPLREQSCSCASSC